MVHFALLLAAAVLFMLAAVPNIAPRINLLAIGLALFALSFLVVAR
jgi:hypothetical protein